MRVKSEGRASPVDRDLLTAAMARLATVPDAGAIEIVIAGDLEASVKKRLPAEEASLYSVRRISGAVGAKTLPRDDGCAIIVDSRLLMPGIAAGAEIDVLRMFEHEAWHVALRRRDEDFYSGVDRLKPTGAWAQYVGQALVLIDESRVERALLERGFALAPSYISSTKETLTACAAAMLDAITNRYPGEPVTRCFETALQAFNSLTTHLSYLAAAAANVADLRKLPSWQRLVGEHYDALVTRLELPPSAVASADADLLDATTNDVGALLHDWLEYVGFEIRDVEGSLYFDVLRHDFS